MPIEFGGKIMHITITGNLGSGKSTICKLLENKYNFTIYSTGKVQRELAREMNISTLEMNKLMCCDPKYDTMIDDATARISRENRDKDIIFDSRLAWNFVEQSFKVFLAVDLDIAAERVHNDNRGKEEEYKDVNEAKMMLLERAKTEDKRYRDMYNLEYFNYSNYNLVIDSTYCTPETIGEIILSEAKNFYKLWKQFDGDFKDFSYHKTLFSPERLYKNKLTDLEKEKIIKNYKPSSYYIGEHIVVKKEEETYTVIEGIEEIKEAIYHKIPYVSVTLL